MMNYYPYFQLAPVLFGRGVAVQTGEVVKKLGCGNALLVTDPGVAAVGAAETVRAALAAAGVAVTVWDQAQMDCPEQTVRDAAAVARAQKVDCVVGVGGGSVLDTAKAVAAVSVNGDGVLGEMPLYLTGQKQYAVPPLAVIEVPTTSGTGSESTFVAVVTSDALDCKIGLPVHPAYGVVDPLLTRTVPQDITAYTGMDAFSHANEALTEQKASRHSDLLAYEAIRLIRDDLPMAIADGSNMEARENLAFASNIAGISFNESGTHIGHSIAHALGHVYHLPHGVCCANVTPAVIAFTARTYPEKMKKLGELMGAVFSSDAPAEIGRAAAKAVREFAARVGVPTFRQLGLDEEKVLAVRDAVWNDALAHAYGGSFTLEDVEQMLLDTLG